MLHRHGIFLVVLLALVGCQLAPAPSMATATIIPSVPPATSVAPEPYPLPASPIALPLTTPRPTFPPTATYTPTPTKTSTPTPTATSIPTIIPPIQTASSEHPFKFASDLLFTQGDYLMQLDHRTGLLAQLAPMGARQAEAGTFSMSADGKKIALLRHLGLDEISLLDRRTLTVTHLETIADAGLSGGSRAFDLQISPDGRWIGYILRDTLPSTSRAGGRALPLAGSAPPQGVIYAIRADAPDQRIELGFCATEFTAQQQYRECNGFLWAPDSRHIVWSDARGAWVNELGAKAHQLAASALTKGGSQGLWGPLLAWSPRGRYVLGQVGHIEGGSYVVLDTDTGRAGDIPTGIGYGFPQTPINWLRDGRLLTLQPADSFSTQIASATLWHVNDVGNPLLSPEKTLTLPVGPKNWPMAPAPLDERHIVLAILNSSASNFAERGLYTLDLANGSLHKLTGIPPAKADLGYLELNPNVRVWWSSDRKEALISGLSTPLLYVPSDGGPLVDIAQPLSNAAEDYVWLPN